MRRRYWIGVLALIVTSSLLVSNIASAAAPNADSEALKAAADLEPTTRAGSIERAPAAALLAGFAARAAVHAARAHGPAVARQYAPAAVSAVTAGVSGAVKAVAKAMGDNSVFLAGTDSRIPGDSHKSVHIEAIFDQ